MSNEFLRLLGLYVKLQFLQFRIHMEYRLDFIIGFLGAFIKHLTGFIFLWGLFTAIPEVQGWDLWEMAFLYGLMVVPRGLVELLFDGTWRLRLLINTGEFDRVLLRPMSPLVQVFTQIFTVHSFGTTGLGFIILIYVSHQVGIVWTVGKLLYLLITLVSSTAIISSINLMTNCIGFWEPSATSTVPFMVANTTELAKFPLSIYSPALQFLFSWILPFAFISYYPGILLLDRPETTWVSYISMLPALILMGIANLVWRVGMTRYQSSGH